MDDHETCKNPEILFYWLQSSTPLSLSCDAICIPMQMEHIQWPTLHLQYVLIRLLQLKVLHTCCAYIVFNLVHSVPVQCPSNCGAVSSPQTELHTWPLGTSSAFHEVCELKIPRVLLQECCVWIQFGLVRLGPAHNKIATTQVVHWVTVRVAWVYCIQVYSSSTSNTCQGFCPRWVTATPFLSRISPTIVSSPWLGEIKEGSNIIFSPHLPIWTTTFNWHAFMNWDPVAFILKMK